jgi:hypothetical protein
MSVGSNQAPATKKSLLFSNFREPRNHPNSQFSNWNGGEQNRPPMAKRGNNFRVARHPGAIAITSYKPTYQELVDSERLTRFF